MPESAIRSRRGFEVSSPGVEPSGVPKQNFDLPHTESYAREQEPILLPQDSSPLEDSSFPGELAVVQGDWWNKQMLVDRSLRVMAALTSAFAIAMVVACLSNLRLFLDRPNRNSTSIGWGSGESCSSVENKNIVCPAFPEEMW